MKILDGVVLSSALQLVLVCWTKAALNCFIYCWFMGSCLESYHFLSRLLIYTKEDEIKGNNQ